MTRISKFRKSLLEFMRGFVNPYTSWRNVYDVWIRGERILSMWGKVRHAYDQWRDDSLGYRDTVYVLILFLVLMTINDDTIRQGIWVFFYEQETLCLLIQSSVLSSLVITSMVSYAVFRTRFLHRIWYCS
jgi:hypothetical protein